MYNFLFLYMGREGSSPILDWLWNHPDVVVPFFEDLDWYNEDIRNYQPIHHLADLAYRYREIEAAKDAFTRAAASHPPRQDKSVGFKWRVWGDPEALAGVLRTNRVKVFHLFRENVLEMAVSMYFSDHVIPRLEKEQKVDLGGGGHFQFALAKMSEQEQARYLELRSRIRFIVDVEKLKEIIAEIVAAKTGMYRDYCLGFTAERVPVLSIRYEDFVEDSDCFFRAICTELGVDFDRHFWEEPPYFKRATRGNLLSQVVNLDEIEELPEVRRGIGIIRSLIYQTHEYLFAPQW